MKKIYFPYVKLILGINRLSGGARGDEIRKLVSNPKIWSMDPKELKDLQFKAIKQAFEHHYNDCKFYGNYCKNNGSVRPEDIKIADDILKIPQMPAEAFKKTRVSSIPANKIKTVVTTSGTSGSPSYLVRDVRSLGLIRMSYLSLAYIIIRKLVEEGIFSGIGEFSHYAMRNWYLGTFSPDSDESSTWLANAFGSFVPFPNLLHIPIDFYLKGFEFVPKKILETIKERNKERKMMIFVGFHYVYNELMRYMDDTGEKLDLDPDGSNLCYIIMAGGWKKLSGEKIDKEEFRRKLSEHFGIREQNIIDAYGFGESNCLALDLCSKRRMHIPPTVLAVTRDPETLEIQDYGKEGLLSVWDPTMHSFPSFVITDDIVKLTEPFKCECGLTTQTMEYVGRAPEAELRSCGLRLQKSLTEEDEKGLEELKEKQKLRTDIGI